ncbi:hypothetical protein TNCV_3653981 [Trichonephila clavipes]|nr:hypothetical protein TNCV_3653981 [Trichonephila clavipes]
MRKALHVITLVTASFQRTKRKKEHGMAVREAKRGALSRISKAKRRKRVTRDMSTLKNSMLELAAKFDDNYNTGLIKSFMFGLNKTEIKTMTDILSRYKFRDSHVNGDRYRAMITNFFIPELNNHDVQELWFQQDGATCHTARATIDLLKDTFGDRLISRFGPVNWPSRS